MLVNVDLTGVIPHDGQPHQLSDGRQGIELCRKACLASDLYQKSLLSYENHFFKPINSYQNITILIT
jgi:hypothetical protein